MKYVYNIIINIHNFKKHVFLAYYSVQFYH